MPGTKPPTNTADSAMLAATANPGASMANALAALSTMAMLTAPTGENLAQLPPERALVFAQALEQLAGEYRRLAGTSGGDLALLAPPEAVMKLATEPTTRMPTSTQPLLLTPTEVAELFQVSTRKLQRMRAAGEGPRPIRIGKKTRRYRRRDVESYLEGKRS